MKKSGKKPASLEGDLAFLRQFAADPDAVLEGDGAGEPRKPRKSQRASAIKASEVL